MSSNKEAMKELGGGGGEKTLNRTELSKLISTIKLLTIISSAKKLLGQDVDSPQEHRYPINTTHQFTATWC